MRRLVLLIITAMAAILALPTLASAKGPIESLAVCGANGCGDVTDAAVLGGPGGADVLFAGGGASDPPPVGEYYRIEAGMPWGDHFSLYLLADGSMMTDPDGGWGTTPPALARALSEASVGLEPMRPHITRVEVDGAAVDDPAAYAALMEPLDGTPQLASDAFENYATWVTIDLTTDRPTPWTPAATVQVIYDPTLGLVRVGSDGWSHAPGELGGRIESDAGIAPGRDLTPLFVLGGIALAAAAAAVLVLLARRMRARPASVA